MVRSVNGASSIKCWCSCCWGSVASSLLAIVWVELVIRKRVTDSTADTSYARAANSKLRKDRLVGSRDGWSEVGFRPVARLP